MKRTSPESMTYCGDRTKADQPAKFAAAIDLAQSHDLGWDNRRIDFVQFALQFLGGLEICFDRFRLRLLKHGRSSANSRLTQTLPVRPEMFTTMFHEKQERRGTRN
jgi:hypothetical protein